jgi:hypothetical protein
MSIFTSRWARRLCVSILFFASGVFAGRYSRDAASTAAPARILVLRRLKALESEDASRREDAYAELNAVFSDIEAVLGNVIRGREPPHQPRGAVDLAARLVGKLHDRVTIVPLVENIECFTGGIRRSTASTHSGFACAETLVEIGDSSVAEILTYLAAKDETDVSDNAIYLFRSVVKAVCQSQNGETESAEAAVRRIQELARPRATPNLDRLLLELRREARSAPAGLASASRVQADRN